MNLKKENISVDLVIWIIDKQHVGCRDVTKISHCRVNTTNRRAIKQLGISVGSSFLLFSCASSRGPIALNDSSV